MKPESEVNTTLDVERAGAFSSPAAFETAQRMAKLLTSSTIVPQTYRENLADTVIALEMANRIGANPLAVMQNLYIVHGRPAWSSQFLISCINASGKFTPLRYEMAGEKGSDSRSCVAWAVDKAGERLEGPMVSIDMAKAEGWYNKSGSKWKTMPELMLRYRAATLFARLYAPDLTMGIHCDDEIIDISSVVADPVRKAKRAYAAPNFLADKPTGYTANAPAAAMPVEVDSAAGNLPKLSRGLLNLTKITEEEFVGYLHSAGMEDSLVTLDEACLMNPERVQAACDDFNRVQKAVRAARKATPQTLITEKQ